MDVANGGARQNKDATTPIDKLRIEYKVTTTEPFTVPVAISRGVHSSTTEFTQGDHVDAGTTV